MATATATTVTTGNDDGGGGGAGGRNTSLTFANDTLTYFNDSILEPSSAEAGSGTIVTSSSLAAPSLPSISPSPSLYPSPPTVEPTLHNDFFLNLGDLNNRPVPTIMPSFEPSVVPTSNPTNFDQVQKKSPELSSIGFVLLYGTVVFVIVLFGFASAMRCRSTHIAPRCEARPRDVIYNPDICCDPSQNKGNPFCFGWVRWVLTLSYKELLQGVPGTGTREGGMKGKMLSVNLDHIILLRFNALGLKISFVSMITYCTICLPIYFYSRCPWVPLGEVGQEDFSDEVHQNCTNEQNYTFSSYSRFTLGNVPDLGTNFATVDYHLSSFLLYMVSIASWIVVWYACFELFHEWIDEVALRRVYYLEYDHWGSAKRDLQATMLDQVRESGSRFNSKDGDVTRKEKHLFERPVWIPHPEQRDTPSNIELYSVLVGGIPMKPDEAMNQEDLEAALANDDSQVDWQMDIVSTFFDSCVPPQPGFSSSVAAVTILPSANELAVAWKCWCIAAKKLSRLRFIRKRIIELGGTPVGQQLAVDDVERQAKTTPSARSIRETKESLRRKEYSAEVLGAGINDDVNDEFWKALDLGPEQIAVYSMEFSRGLAGCCPHGFCEQRISYCRDLDLLLEMEAEAADAVSKAYVELKAAGEMAAMSHQRRQNMMKLTDVVSGTAKTVTGTAKTVTAVPTKLASKVTEATGVSARVSQITDAAGISDRLNRMSSREDMKKKKKMQKFKSTTEMNLMKKRRQTQMNNGGNNNNYGRSQYLGGLDSLEESQDESDSTDADVKVNTSVRQSRRSSGFDSGLLRRATAARMSTSMSDDNSFHTEKDSELWNLVETIAYESKNHKQSNPSPYRVQDGQWAAPTIRRAYKGFRKKFKSLLSWTGDNANEGTDLLARDSTFAVVTFTTRQGAIAARQCLVDGRGAEAFTTARVHPVPPLADSAALNVCDFRGCTKPVTIGLNEYQKSSRNTFVTVAVCALYIFYATPIAILSEYGTQLVLHLFPKIQESVDESTIDGFLQAQLLSIILAFLPELFLFLANVGSNATSMVEAENAAFRYYWYFMLCFALIGQSIARMFTQAYNSGSLDVQDILQTVARTIPVEVSFTWTNWIINRALTLTPTFYLLQLNNFLFACIGGHCCVRMLKGGGSGNRLPYRIYVENATVLLCTLALAPAAPILSPFAVLYFLVCTPLLRYVVTFTYKPLYDSGGSRWPMLFDSIIVSLIVSQILLATILVLKQAIGAAIFAFLPVGFILMFAKRVKDRFLQAFLDAALLQTSMLDGWDVGPDSEQLGWESREEFRKFIVDAHKAAYVPVCIAATQMGKNSMTAEPAVVIPTTEKERDEMTHGDLEKDKRAAFKLMGKEKTQQFGALNRRHLMDVSTSTATSPLFTRSNTTDASNDHRRRRGPWNMSTLSALDISVSESETERVQNDSITKPQKEPTEEETSSQTPTTEELAPRTVEEEVYDEEVSERRSVRFESPQDQAPEAGDESESSYEECISTNGDMFPPLVEPSDREMEIGQSEVESTEAESNYQDCDPMYTCSWQLSTDSMEEQQGDQVEIEMIPGASPLVETSETSPRVKNLGSIFTLDSGERKYIFATENDKEKEE